MNPRRLMIVYEAVTAEDRTAKSHCIAVNALVEPYAEDGQLHFQLTGEIAWRRSR